MQGLLTTKLVWVEAGLDQYCVTVENILILAIIVMISIS